MTMLVHPPAWDMFSSAIMESYGQWSLNTFSGVQNNTLNYAATLGCGNPDTALACLRSLPAMTVLPDTELGTPWGPTDAWGLCVDNVLIAGQPTTLFNEGKWAQVPLMLGFNIAEQNLLGFFNTNNTPPALGLSDEVYTDLVRVVLCSFLYSLFLFFFPPLALPLFFLSPSSLFYLLLLYLSSSFLFAVSSIFLFFLFFFLLISSSLSISTDIPDLRSSLRPKLLSSLRL